MKIDFANLFVKYGAATARCRRRRRRHENVF